MHMFLIRVEILLMFVMQHDFRISRDFKRVSLALVLVRVHRYLFMSQRIEHQANKTVDLLLAQLLLRQC